MQPNQLSGHSELAIYAPRAFAADSFTFTSPGTVVWDSVYVNPYQATDNTQPQNPLTIYCDDWNTEFTGNPTWDANVYTLTAANAPNFKYGTIKSAQTVTLAGTLGNYSLQSGLPNNNPNVYDLYLEAADLDQQLADTPSPSNTVQDELAATEWLIFVNSSHASGLIGAINSSGSAFADAVHTDLSIAQAAAPTFDPTGWDVCPS